MSLETAPSLISTAIGSSSAAVLFAVALLLSGQASTVVSTLAGQIVMEGFLDLRVRPWVRRLVTRGLALIPGVIVVATFGEVSHYLLHFDSIPSNSSLMAASYRDLNVSTEHHLAILPNMSPSSLFHHQFDTLISNCSTL